MKYLSSALVLVLIAGLSLSGCQKKTDTQTATFILFSEQEAGGSPYQTRVLITKEFVRIDDGEKAEDYILFDRKTQQVNSVIGSAEQVMLLSMQAVTMPPPIELALSHKEIGIMKDAPEIEGKRPTHHQFLAKEQVCHDVVVVTGLLPDYVEAIKEFNLVLAGESALTLGVIPADMQNACDMARSVFAPNRYLEFGFPIQEWDHRGFQRSLLDYKLEVPIEPGTFTIPEDYRRVTMQEMRGEL